MKAITAHQINELNEQITIVADDRDAGNGNASHNYDVHFADRKIAIPFQHGVVKAVGVNGVTNEALLAIVIDRLQGFQEGAFSCRENAVALTHLETALMWLQKRTRDRVVRGVEGTHQK